MDTPVVCLFVCFFLSLRLRCCIVYFVHEGRDGWDGDCMYIMLTRRVSTGILLLNLRYYVLTIPASCPLFPYPIFQIIVPNHNFAVISWCLRWRCHCKIQSGSHRYRIIVPQVFLSERDSVILRTFVLQNQMYSASILCGSDGRRGDTLYFSFSRPSKSILVAHLLAIQITHHIIPGTALIQINSEFLYLTNPSNNTTPAKSAFNTGINLSGPSSTLVGRIPCRRDIK